jgi:hypothetical protein
VRQIENKIEFCYDVSAIPRRYLKFSLILIINFNYVINKLIILTSDHTNLILIHHLKYLSIDISLFLTSKFRFSKTQ